MTSRVEWLLKHVKGHRILDIGFVGNYEQPVIHIKLRKKNPTSIIVGIDINKDGVHKHKLHNSVLGDAFNLPFKENSFDSVVIAEVLEHVDYPIGLLREANRVLKKGGKLFITTPNPFSLYRVVRFWLLRKNPKKRDNYKKFCGDPDHLQFFDPLSLCNMLEFVGFKVLDIETVNFTFISLSKKGLKTIDLNIPFYPFNRLGAYLCIITKKEREVI